MTNDYTFNPPAVLPGDVILDYLEDAEITREQFIEKLGISTGAGILDGTTLITRDIASKLEVLLGRRAHFWLRLQRRWLGVEEWLWDQAPELYRNVHPARIWAAADTIAWSAVAFVPAKVYPGGEARLFREPDCVRALWKWAPSLSRVHVDGGVTVAWTTGGDSAKLPCDPEGACASHGRCWTHSTWDDYTIVDGRIVKG